MNTTVTDTTLRNALARELFIQNGLGAIVVDPSRRADLEKTWDAPGEGGRGMWLRIADALLPHIDDWHRRRCQSITARSGDTGIDGDDLRMQVAAALIAHDHPEEPNPLTRPDDPLVMLRTDPKFHICVSALSRADAVLALMNECPPTQWAYDQACKALRAHRERAEVAESEEHRAKDDLRSTRTELIVAMDQLDRAHEDLTSVKAEIDRLNEAQKRDAEYTEQVESERDDLRALFNLQQTRMQEATEAWRAEAPAERELIAPDLGDLLAWLLQRAEAYKVKLKTARSEYDEFLEELDRAFGLEDGEESLYSNPEGAAEGIYIDVAAAYKRELDENRAAVKRVRRVVEQDTRRFNAPAVANAVRDALDGPFGEPFKESLGDDDGD